MVSKRCFKFVPEITFVNPNLCSGTLKRVVMERGVFAFACQYIASLRGQTGNRTATQMGHPLFVEGRPNCARQSLASTLSAPGFAATLYCDPGRHAKVVIPCLLTPCFNVPNMCNRMLFRWGQCPGCKGICVSPPLLLDVPPFGITLTLRRLHLQS